MFIMYVLSVRLSILGKFFSRKISILRPNFINHLRLQKLHYDICICIYRQSLENGLDCVYTIYLFRNHSRSETFSRHTLYNIHSIIFEDLILFKVFLMLYFTKCDSQCLRLKNETSNSQLHPGVLMF